MEHCVRKQGNTVHCIIALSRLIKCFVLLVFKDKILRRKKITRIFMFRFYSNCISIDSFRKLSVLLVSFKSTRSSSWSASNFFSTDFRTFFSSSFFLLSKRAFCMSLRIKTHRKFQSKFFIAVQLKPAWHLDGKPFAFFLHFFFFRFQFKYFLFLFR